MKIFKQKSYEIQNFKNIFSVVFAILLFVCSCSSTIDSSYNTEEESDNFILNDDYFGVRQRSGFDLDKVKSTSTVDVTSSVSSSVSDDDSDDSSDEKVISANDNEDHEKVDKMLILENMNSMEVRSPVAEVFLTKGNTEETIPLSSESTKEILITEEMVRNGSVVNHVVLLCNASYPVEWLYEGVGAPRLYTTQIRTFGDFFNKETYGHSSIIVLVQEKSDEQQTGSYICAGIDSPHLRTGFHLYFKGEFGFPSLQNVVVQPGRNDSIVLLPCPTTDPAATIGLYKVAPFNDSRNLTLDGSFSYDPRRGFLMKLSDMENPYGRYECKFKNFESYWKIDLVRPKEEEVEVIPNAKLIHMNNLQYHRFICNAKEPIQIMLPNTVNFGMVEYNQNESNNEFPFQAMLTITPNVPIYSIASYFKVNCQSKKTRRILHTWEYSNFGSEELRVSYDKDQKRLLCCSKSGLTPIHEMAKCETVTDCRIKQNCFASGRCDYAFPPKFVDAPRGCTAIEFMDDFPSHVMRCSVGDLKEMMLVTSNIANDNLIIYDGSTPVDTEDILKIANLGQKSNNEVQVRCVASIFYFSTNIMFAFQYKNGSLVFADESLIENVNSYGPTLKTFVDSTVDKIMCFAPLTRSSEWRNASLTVIAIDDPVRKLMPQLPTNIPLSKSPFSQTQIRSVREHLFDTDELENHPHNNNSFNRKHFITSVKTSTSVSTYLRSKQGHLIKVLQDS